MITIKITLPQWTYIEPLLTAAEKTKLRPTAQLKLTMDNGFARELITRINHAGASSDSTRIYTTRHALWNKIEAALDASASADTSMITR